MVDSVYKTSNSLYQWFSITYVDICNDDEVDFSVISIQFKIQNSKFKIPFIF